MIKKQSTAKKYLSLSPYFLGRSPSLPYQLAGVGSSGGAVPEGRPGDLRDPSASRRMAPPTPIAGFSVSCSHPVNRIPDPITSQRGNALLRQWLRQGDARANAALAVPCLYCAL
jgi:hypothetical protein